MQHPAISCFRLCILAEALPGQLSMHHMMVLTLEMFKATVASSYCN